MSAEIGQILHNNPIGVTTPDFADALVDKIRETISWAYWNVNQRKWRGSASFDPWAEEDEGCTFDPLPPGIEWRGYYNWGGSPEDPDWDQEEANKPNFSFEGVEVRWYKRYGRSVSELARAAWRSDAIPIARWSSRTNPGCGRFTLCRAS